MLEAAFRLVPLRQLDDSLRVEPDAYRRDGAATERSTVTGRRPAVAWSHHIVEDDFLLKEYRKALKDRLSPPCGKPFKKLLHPSNVADAEAAATAKLICYDCGVACDLSAMKQERLFYLRRMNAWLPSESKPAVREPADGSGAGRRSTTAPPKRAAQATPHRYRLRYTKLGRVAFLGKLTDGVG